MKLLFRLLVSCIAILAANCSQVVSTDNDDLTIDAHSPQIDSLFDIVDTIYLDSIVYYDKDSLIHLRDSIGLDSNLHHELDSILNIIDTIHIDTIVHTNTISYVLANNSIDTLYRLDTTDYIVYITRNIDSVYKLDTIRIDTVSLRDTTYWNLKIQIKDSIPDTTYQYYSTKKFHKLSKKINEYPYYEYVNGLWSFEDWKNEPPYYYLDLFDSIKHTLVDQQVFPYQAPFSLSIHLDTIHESQSSDLGYYFFAEKSKKYLLSFDVNDSIEPPILRVGKINSDNKFHTLKAIEYNNRWYYPIDSTVIDSNLKVLDVKLYNSDYSWIKNKLKNFVISTLHSSEIIMNMIILGKYMGTEDSVSIDILAQRVQDRMNIALNPGGINVKQMNILYAKDHPVVGDAFPETENIKLYRYRENNPIQDFMDSVSKWPGHEGEFSFVLGHYFSDDDALGLSTKNGTFYTGPQSYNCPTHFSVATYYSDGITPMNSATIANVAIHELGHYFGLEHTTDQETNISDNLEDTPKCPKINEKNYDIFNCPDYGYIMFPQTSQSFQYATFTPQQMSIIRRYLTSKPHK